MGLLCGRPEHCNWCPPRSPRVPVLVDDHHPPVAALRRALRGRHRGEAVSVDHSKRHAAEDARNEHARVQKLAAHEADVRRLLHDRWWRRMQALMPSETPVVVQDFGTECTL